MIKYFSVFLCTFFFWSDLYADYSEQVDLNRRAMLAIANDEFEVVKALVDEGFDPAFKLGAPENSLRVAIIMGHEDIFLYLKEQGANLDHQLDERMYFINLVAPRVSFEVFASVIDDGVSLDHVIYLERFTVFTFMLRSLDVDRLRYTLENGNVDINLRPPHGYSALYRNYVINECGLECLKIMLEFCADASAPIITNGVSFEGFIKESNDRDAMKLINQKSCKNN